MALSEASEARVAELKLQLAAVREQITAALEASSLSIDGASLTRQSIAVLERREASLTWDIQTLLRGSSVGAIRF